MEENRRQNDILLGKLIGQFEEFRKEYQDDREEERRQRAEFHDDLKSKFKSVSDRITVIEDFTNKLKKPYKAAVTIVVIMAIGLTKMLFDFVKSHVYWG